MKVLLTTPAYLHGDLRLERHIYKSIVFYCNINVFFYMHLYDGSEMRINHCKNV